MVETRGGASSVARIVPGRLLPVVNIWGFDGDNGDEDGDEDGDEGGLCGLPADHGKTPLSGGTYLHSGR